MTRAKRAREYRAKRIERGTQVSVAKQLGVDPQTISRRERAEIEITREAEIALESLPKLTTGTAKRTSTKAP